MSVKELIESIDENQFTKANDFFKGATLEIVSRKIEERKAEILEGKGEKDKDKDDDNDDENEDDDDDNDDDEKDED
jgi:hypothetical protein